MTDSMPNSMSNPMSNPMVKQLAEILDEYKVSTKEKNTCLKKALITMRVKEEKGELNENDPIHLVKGEKHIAILDKHDAIIFFYLFEELVSTPNTLIKEEIVEELIKHESLFQKDLKSRTELNEIGFYKHQHFNSWCYFNAIGLIYEIKRFEEQSGKKITLKDCDVKTCKIKGRKYKRITFTNEKHITQLSHIEFTFGTMINGWTYIMLPEKWAQIKDEVISLVDYQETTYGSKTRWDLEGNEYKAEH